MKIVILGLCPNAYEEQTNQGFCTSAGDLIKKLLFYGGIDINSIHCTYLSKKQVHAPTMYKLGVPTIQAYTCLKQLKDELSYIPYHVIVPLGETLLNILTEEHTIMNWRGSILTSVFFLNKKIIPLLEPQFLLKNYIEQQYTIIDSNKILSESISNTNNKLKRNLIINPSLNQAIRWFEGNQELENETKELALDIEWSGQLQISCISFAYKPGEAISIPVANYTVEEEYTIWKLIAQKIEDPTLCLVGQNIAFDLYDIMWKYNIIPQGTLGDTMIAHNIIFSEYLKNLGFLNSVYTKEPYYKDDLKEWKLVKDWPKFWRYNAKDSATTLEIWQILKKKIKSEGYQSTYDMTERLHYPLFLTQYRGVRADQKGIKEIKIKINLEVCKLQKELDTQIRLRAGDQKKVIVDKETQSLGLLNVSSTKQKIAYFYTKLKIPPYRTKGKVTCDEKALSRLGKGTKSRSGIPEAIIAKNLISLKKFRDTYLNMKLNIHGRFDCKFNPRGTRFGRMSSSKTSIKTGMNMQNIPFQFKGFLQADAGYLMYELDKKGAEWVIMAQLTQDENMLKVINSDISPHVSTSHMLTGIPIEIIEAEDKLLEHETNPIHIAECRYDFWSDNPGYQEFYQKATFYPKSSSIRQSGKGCNFGFNYDLRHKSFALDNNIPESEALLLYNGYHGIYPGIHKFHAEIQEQLAIDRTLFNCFGRKLKFHNAWNDALFREAYCFIPQSTIGDIINIAWADIYESKDRHLQEIEILGCVHDSLLFQIPLMFPISFHIECIEKVRQLLEPTLQYKGQNFIVQTEGKVGSNWGEMDSFSFDQPKKQWDIITKQFTGK